MTASTSSATGVCAHDNVGKEDTEGLQARPTLGVFSKPPPGYKSPVVKSVPRPSLSLADRLCFFRPEELKKGNDGDAPVSTSIRKPLSPVASNLSDDTTIDEDENEDDDRSSGLDSSSLHAASEFSDSDNDGYDADDDDTHAIKLPPRLSHFDRTIRALKEYIDRRKRKKPDGSP